MPANQHENGSDHNHGSPTRLTLYEIALLGEQFRFLKDFSIERTRIDLTTLPEEEKDIIAKFRCEVLNQRHGMVDERFRRKAESE